MGLYSEINQAVKDIKHSYKSSNDIVIYISDECFSEIKSSNECARHIDTMNSRVFGYRFFIVSSFQGHKRINAAIY